MSGRATEIRYLRQKAKLFREMADEYRTELSSRLREIAEEFDARAAELEQRD